MQYNHVTNEIKIDSGVDVLLALIYAKGTSNKTNEKIYGTTRLIKLMYILSKETGFSHLINESYNFEPYSYGPCAPEIYADILALEDRNILQVNKSTYGNKLEEIDICKIFEIEHEKFVREYQLTERGLALGKKIHENLTKTQKEKLRTVKSIYNSMDSNQLIQTIYSKYIEPEQEN